MIYDVAEMNRSDFNDDKNYRSLDLNNLQLNYTEYLLLLFYKNTLYR